MSLAFDVNDQGVEIIFAPSFAADDLPNNRVSLTGINQQNILRMRGVAGGGALTAGAQRVPHRSFVILSGQPQDRAEDGADILPHEKLKLELAQAFGSEIAQMGDVVRAIMAALDPSSPLDVSQKAAVQDAVRDLIALKVLMNTGDIQASQIIVAAQGLLDRLVTTLKTSENAPILPPQLAQFIQGVVTQVAVQYNAPLLMTAVERLAPLVAAFLPETPSIPMTFQPQSFVSDVSLPLASVAKPSISQAVPEFIQPAVSAIEPLASAPIISPPSAAAPIIVQTIVNEPAPVQRAVVMDAAIPIAVAAAFVGNTEAPVTKPSVAQESSHQDRPMVKDAPQMQPPIVKPDAPIQSAVPNAPQVKQAEAAAAVAQPVAVAAPLSPPKASDKPQASAPAMQPATVKPADIAAVPVSLAVEAAPIAPVKIEMPVPSVIAMAAPLYAPVATTSACGKTNCDCSKDFRAVSGTPFEIKTALVMDLGEKTTASILAKYDGDVQKAAVFVATEQKAQAKALDAISMQMQIAETGMKSSQTKAMDALSRSILGVASGASATRSAFTKSCADGTCDHDHHKPGAAQNDEPLKSEKVKRAKFDRGTYKPKSL